MHGINEYTSVQSHWDTSLLSLFFYNRSRIELSLVNLMLSLYRAAVHMHDPSWGDSSSGAHEDCDESLQCLVSSAQATGSALFLLQLRQSKDTLTVLFKTVCVLRLWI